MKKEPIDLGVNDIDSMTVKGMKRNRTLEIKATSVLKLL